MLIAPVLLELGHEPDGLIGRAHPERRDDFNKGSGTVLPAPNNRIPPGTATTGTYQSTAQVAFSPPPPQYPPGTSRVITDINVTLSLTHTFDSDLQIFIISPNGITIPLDKLLAGAMRRTMKRTLAS